MDLNRMVTFATAIEHGSFTAAARELRISKAAVSKQITTLEAELGTKLLNRSTRSLSLTDAGRIYLEHCREVVRAADAAKTALSELNQVPTGRLRISAPIGIGERHVARLVQSFMQTFPRVEIDLIIEDAVVNIIQENIDVVIRAGKVSDSSLRARRLGKVELVILASPDYLKKTKTPRSPNALVSHNWVAFSPLGNPQRLVFERGGKRFPVRLRGRLTTNNGAVIRDCLCSGFGIGLLPRFYVQEELESGVLKQLLQQYDLPAGDVFALHPYDSHPPPKVRLFVEHLTKNWRA